jgi:hypothetical protein
LVVERVPEKHQKDLTPREIDQVQELHVFVVPSKVELVDGERVVHKPIVFMGECLQTMTFIPKMVTSGHQMMSSTNKRCQSDFRDGTGEI